MAKNTTIFTLLQNFISQDEIYEIFTEFGFEDTNRKCDVPMLLIYKERWAIESLFLWIKQNLNVPVLFGTIKNAAVFSQLFSALIAYVLLKFLHNKGHKKNNCKRLTVTVFTH